MEGNTFKGALFGGFNRQDVISYIEKTAGEANARIESLEQETESARAAEAELRGELASVAGERDRLSGELADANNARETLRASLDEANAERESLRARIEALEAEKAVLSENVSALRAQAKEYCAMKSRIAEIELDARKRADQLEADTRGKLNGLIDACRSQCGLVLSTLGDTCVNVSDELRKAEAMVSQLPHAFNSLRDGLSELEKQE